jgi:hypothetical protein
MIRVMLTAAALAVSGLALAKLPPLDDAAKAKAAEAAAKAAWQGKVDNYQLCKVQDRVAAAYKKTAAAKPAAMPASAAPAAPAAPTAAASATPSNSGNPTTTAQGGGTPAPVANTSLAACMDPGPFAYAPPEQKPLETSGAHSPAANATSPPSVKANSAEMVPVKPGTASAAPAKKP